jgi:hypothetical protein
MRRQRVGRFSSSISQIPLQGPPALRLERFPIAWDHVIDKESLKIKTLEQVLIEKVCQLFRSLL